MFTMGIIMLIITLPIFVVSIIKLNKSEDLSDDQLGWLITLAVLIIPLSIGVCFAIAAPITAHSEVIKYKEKCEMIQEVVLNGNEYENISITQTIIEQNSWLSEAKADKKMFGIFSMYLFEDIDSLEYIKIEKGE